MRGGGKVYGSSGRHRDENTDVKCLLKFKCRIRIPPRAAVGAIELRANKISLQAYGTRGREHAFTESFFPEWTTKVGRNGVIGLDVSAARS